VEGDPPVAIPESRDLGFMLLDIDFAAGARPVFFRAEIVDGVINVPRMEDAGARR
jgi:CRISPR-associated protein Cas5d